MTDRRICAIDSSSREDLRTLTDSRVEFWERAIERSSTAEVDEKSKPDNVNDLRLVLVESLSRKAFAREALEQWADENRQDDCELCCCEALLLLPINLPPLMMSESVELLNNTICRISSNNWLLVSPLWIAQSKNLMLENLRRSRTRILRRLWIIRGDHVQFQKMRLRTAQSLSLCWL